MFNTGQFGQIPNIFILTLSIIINLIIAKHFNITQFSQGVIGTDVAKEASDIIITDDSFLSIIKAIMWGRCIYDNITKFIQFQMAFNVVALCLTLLGSCFRETPPIKVINVLKL